MANRYARPLSKSKLVAFRQCPKRLWLELHRPELAVYEPRSEAIFRVGHQVGEIARHLYDPDGTGTTLDLQVEGVARAIDRTRSLLGERRPIFEAGFSADGTLAFADVLLPVESDGRDAWRMVEVKSSTSVKDYQRDDCAIQSFAATRSGISLAAVVIAHIDTSWTYQGDGDYRGLLTEVDLTTDARSRYHEVADWIARAQKVAARTEAPNVAMGTQCSSPFDCPFLGYCSAGSEPHPALARWLPDVRSVALHAFLQANPDAGMDQVPDALLNDTQRRVRDVTLSGVPYFDREAARAELAKWPPPAHFLDLETVQFAVPRWRGTRPFQAIPFQYSLHRIDAEGRLEHTAFLDLTGEDPRRALATALVEACAGDGPIFVYNIGFEASQIRKLAVELPDLASTLMAVHDRLVDLLPIVRRTYYHASQQGSWSIKKVLPAMDPSARYDDLDGVQSGGMVQEAYETATDPVSTETTVDDIRRQLLDYCALDTRGMVEIWRRLTGKHS